MATKKKKLTHPLPEAGHSRGHLQNLWPFYFTSSSPPPPCAIKETGIQTLIRWLFWDFSLLSSWSASFPNKVVFLASTPHLWFIGLSCGEQSELGLSNRLGLASQESCCSWLVSPSQGTSGQGPNSCQDYLSWGSSLQNSLKRHRLPQHLAVEARNRPTSASPQTPVCRVNLPNSVTGSFVLVLVLLWFCVSFCVVSRQTQFCRVGRSCVLTGNIFPSQFGFSFMG